MAHGAGVLMQRRRDVAGLDVPSIRGAAGIVNYHPAGSIKTTEREGFEPSRP